MKIRTEKQIKTQIRHLQDERKSIRQFSMFGDNNWEKLDSEIEFLQKYLDGDVDESEFDDILAEKEEELGGEHFMECPEKQAIDFIQGY